MTIVHLATYPVGVPRHGGQLRVAAIQSKLREAGFESRLVAVTNPWAYPEEPESAFTLMMNEEFLSALGRQGRREDLHAYEFVTENRERFTRLIETINKLNPEVFVLEQPWLWPLLKVAKQQVREWEDIPIIYSSQNVESVLMEDITASFPKGQRRALVKETMDLEKDLVDCAKVVVAVTEADARHFGQLGAKHVVVCANGISPRPEPGGIEYWEERLNGMKMALFVGSAHPPNAAGFMEMVGPALGYLPPDIKVIVAGQVDGLIRTKRAYRRYEGVNASRIIFVGKQDEGGLSSLIELTDLVLLPITKGSGSNIKTAEALYNRRRILATSNSLIGYENFRGFPTLTVADEPARYKAAMTSLLSEATDRCCSLSSTHELQLETLRWTNSLQPYPELILSVLAAR